MASPLRHLDRIALRLLAGDAGEGAEDFVTPPGEPALVPADSVSWRVFGNPVTLWIGGVAAVLMELGEPRVRHGVWEHSDFRRDPARRLRRTGHAAMVTVYGARSRFERLAAGVRAMHARVRGVTDAGVPYAADDPELLRWVQATAAWGFAEAYHRYAAPLTAAERDAYHAEGEAGARLYGVPDPPTSLAATEALFAAMAPKLAPSPVLRELLNILARAPILPAPLRPLQGSVNRAAVALMPAMLRARIGLATAARPRPGETALLRTLAAIAERVPLASAPRALALRRLMASGTS